MTYVTDAARIALAQENMDQEETTIRIDIRTKATETAEHIAERVLTVHESHKTKREVRKANRKARSTARLQKQVDKRLHKMLVH